MIRKVSKDGIDYTLKDSLSHAEGTALTSTTLETDTKLQKMSENLRSLENGMKVSSKAKKAYPNVQCPSRMSPRT